MLSFGALASKVFGSSNDRKLKKYGPSSRRSTRSSQRSRRCRTRRCAPAPRSSAPASPLGPPLDDLIPEAFATVREAAKRTLGQRHFDVQLIGGMVLHEGRIAEMKTGEGKTLVATLPVYLNALTGKGVHVVTVNDYLAKRDAAWMGAIYEFLGLKVGCIVHELSDPQRREAYACDVTYGTNNEFGFDYLRDNMKYAASEMVQRGHYFAIVDEVDSILIDEARTPLIISGPARRPLRALHHHRQVHPGAGGGRFRARREDARRDADRGRQRACRAAADEGRPAQGRVALRHRERHRRAPRAAGAARAQAVPARPRLHRQERRGDHHRRVHRAHDAGPALFRRPAPGARGEGACGDPAREPDARHHHLPELFPALREARRHDRHGLDRSRRVHGHLRPRRGRGADQHGHDPRRRGRRGLSHRAGEIPGHHRADQGGARSAASRCWSAPPRSRNPRSSPAC